MSPELPSVGLWLFLLGAIHGLNPGMGWLFAVALGLQERSARAVWRALLPLAIGHALAIGAAILLGALLGVVMPLGALEWLVGAALVGFGVFRLFRHSHPRGGGMQVGMRDLALWSLLMASAHGAGLMVLPLVLSNEPAGVRTLHAISAEAAEPEVRAARHHQHEDDAPHRAGTPGGHGHAEHLGMDTAGARLGGFTAALVHTLGYLVMTGMIALVVYHWVGLHLLRTAWINLDLLWATALIATGVLTPLL